MLALLSCGASPTKGIMPLPSVHMGAVQAAKGSGEHRAHGGYNVHEDLVINYVMSLKSVLPAPKPLGATHVILGFIEPSTKELPNAVSSDRGHSWLRGAAAEYAKLSRFERQELRKQLGTATVPAKIMASVGGPRAKHDDFHWPTFNPEAFGTMLAETVIKLELDGVDIDLEGWSRWVGNDGKKPGSTGAGGATGNTNIRFQNENDAHFIATAHNGTREGNNIGRSNNNWLGLGLGLGL